MKTLNTKILFVLFFIFFISACSQTKTFDSPSVNWLSSGSISISRPAPSIIDNESPNVLGFLPFQSNKKWLKINSQEKTISLMNGSNAVIKSNYESIKDFESGRYYLAMKQKNSLWYADDNYFINRNLEIPDKNSQQRYFKSALGEFSLYLDSNKIIHSSILNDEDVGGLIIKNEDLGLIFNSLMPDDLIIVK